MTALTQLVARIVNPADLTAREHRTEEARQSAIRVRQQAEHVDPRIEALRKSYTRAGRRLSR